MIDIESTRWCEHGKRHDDYCEACEKESAIVTTDKVTVEVNPDDGSGAEINHIMISISSQRLAYPVSGMNLLPFKAGLIQDLRTSLYYAIERIAELERQREELIDDLKNYGSHAADCLGWISRRECTCGLGDVIAKAESP